MPSRKFILKPVIQGDGLPIEIKREAKTEYSPGIKRGTTSVLRGLKPDEENKFLPKVLNTSSSSPNWETVLEDYWSDYSMSIPFDGMEIEGGIENGTPINLEHYILANLFLNDDTVAKGEDVDNAGAFNFLIIDKSAVEKAKLGNLEISTKADGKWAELASNEANTDVLRWIVLGLQGELGLSYSAVRNSTRDELKLIIYEFKGRNPVRFIEAASDTNLKEVALIVALVDSDIIKKEGAAYYDEDVLLANTMKEMISYVKSQTNSAKIAQFQTRLKVSQQ